MGRYGECCKPHGKHRHSDDDTYITGCIRSDKGHLSVYEKRRDHDQGKRLYGLLLPVISIMHNNIRRKDMKSVKKTAAV